MTGYDE
jgi:ribosomal protein L19